MNTHIGKMRNVYGEVHPQKFEDIKTSEVSSEGLLVDANSQYLAVKFYLKIFLFLGLLGSQRRRCCSNT